MTRPYFWSDALQKTQPQPCSFDDELIKRLCTGKEAGLPSLRRLPQQVPEQRVALFADVAQTPAIGTGVLAGNQSEITGHLLAATKSIGSAQDQHKSQCCDRPHSRMALQSLHLWNPLRFLLDRLAQLVDVGVEAVQQIQQFLPPPRAPGR